MIDHASLPVDPGVLWPFLATIALIELTPGPNMGYLAVVTLGRGRLAGLAVVAGVTVGLSVYMLAAAFGVAELFVRFPLAYQTLRWAGVAYLFWLAWEAWRGLGETSPGHTDTPDGLRSLFRRGLVANLLNPKAAVFYVMVLPEFMHPDHASILVQALVLGSLHVLLSVVVHGAIVLGAARVTGMARAAPTRLTRRLFGLALAAIAVWLAWETRR